MPNAQASTESALLVNPLQKLHESLSEDLEEVNSIILGRMQSHVQIIPELAGHLIKAGGKRVRPLLTLASARMCGYEGHNRHARLAACVEFIHTATLLHDDVVDESDQRRGLASANAIFGNQATVLVGDFLFSRAFQLMVEDKSLEVLRILSNASAVIAEGEVLQLSITGNIETSFDSYLDVIKAKTAELFAASCEVGGIIAERPDKEVDALRDYGLNLGIAFQMADDLLDYSADEARLGKTIGDDFREGKLSLPVILALSKASESEREFWQRCIEEGRQEEQDLATALEIIDLHNIHEEGQRIANGYGTRARETLAAFNGQPHHAELHDLVQFSIDRAY